jgi:hypothetical protein
MATTNYGFTTLTGGENAGWQSINVLINSIDANLGGRLPLRKAASENWANFVPFYNPADDGVTFSAGRLTGANFTDSSITTSKIADGAVISAKIADGQVTAAKLPSAVDLSTKSSVSVPNVPSASDNSVSAANTAFVQDAITAAVTGGQPITASGIAPLTITYDRLNPAVNRYMVGSSSNGSYYTSSGVLDETCLASYPGTIASTGSPVPIITYSSTGPRLVIAESASDITLTLPSGLGVAGDTITIARYGAGAVTIAPSGVTINGTSNTFSIPERYSKASLVCISTNVWTINTTGVQLGKGYTFVETVYFTSSGSFTKATYPWLRAIYAVCLAGGGGGGGIGSLSGSQGAAGGGGGAGAMAERFITDIASLAASETITVGAGGVAGNGGAGSPPSISGGVGGASQAFLMTCTGGNGGDDGFGSSSVSTTLAGSGGLAAVNGDLNILGGSGKSGFSLPAVGLASSGNGGSGRYGQGGIGFMLTSPGGGALGESGTGYGSGGSGASGLFSSTSRSGGAGKPGLVIAHLFA